MSYSRRQLYALGEPIGDSATYRKVDGGLILGDGGGGGGGGAPAAQTQTQVSDLPEWSKGYAQDVLAKGQALTQTPYQPYGAQRIAGFTPMQEQAFQGAAQLGPTEQTALGTGLAAAAGAGALGTQYQAGRFGAQQVQAPYLQQFQMAQPQTVGTGTFTGEGTASQFMSPYMQNVVDVQQREAQRQSDIAAQGQRAQAVQAGAYGGSRQGLVEAERQRNLATQLGQIQATGLQSAYQQAQQQYNTEQQSRLQAALANQAAGLTAGGQNLAALLGVQQLGAGQNLQAQQLNQAANLQAQQLREQSRQYGAGLGLQGLQTGLQAAGTLGGLGQQQFAQQQGAIQAQTAAGAQQQAQQQKSLDTAYQDYLTQLNYPYQQLSYMSNLIRGTPMGMNTQSQVYQPAPTGLQTLGALGLGAYGLGKIGGFKAGGMVSFDDGGSVGDGLGVVDKFNDVGYMAAQMTRMSDEQLQQMVQNPTTPAEGAAAQQELNRRQEAMMTSERQGLAGAYNQLPYESQQRMIRAAGGGILAFKDGDAVSSSNDDDGPSQQDLAEALYGGRIADPNLQRQLMRRQMGITDYLLGRPTYRAPTKEERTKGVTDYISEMQKYGGENPYGGMNQYIQEQMSGLNQEREEGKGLAALEAIPAMLQPGGFTRAAGAAAASMGGSFAKLAQSQRSAKNSLMQMQFNLKDAERKERMGLYRDARASQAEAERNAIAADKADRESIAAAGNIIAKTMQANRVVGGGAGAGNKEWTYATKTYLPLAKQEHPDASPAELEAYAYQMYQQGRGPGLAGAQGRIESAEQKNKEELVKEDLFYNRDYSRAKRKGDTDTANRIENAARQRRGLPPLPDTTPAPRQTTTPQKVTSQAQYDKLPSGTVFVAPDGSVRTKP